MLWLKINSAKEWGYPLCEQGVLPHRCGEEGYHPTNTAASSFCSQLLTGMWRPTSGSVADQMWSRRDRLTLFPGFKVEPAVLSPLLQSEWPVKEKFNSSWQETRYTPRLLLVLFLFLIAIYIIIHTGCNPRKDWTCLCPTWKCDITTKKVRISEFVHSLSQESLHCYVTSEYSP